MVSPFYCIQFFCPNGEIVADCVYFPPLDNTCLEPRFLPSTAAAKWEDARHEYDYFLVHALQIIYFFVDFPTPSASGVTEHRNQSQVNYHNMVIMIILVRQPKALLVVVQEIDALFNFFFFRKELFCPFKCFFVHITLLLFHCYSFPHMMLGVGNAVNAKLSDSVLVRHVELPL